ncbi:MAG: hypothetical protein EYC70_12225 [Planctomycetota bacterium]|nr:MAG: hypothetical protein EYC70_12225 [Planctomycetota bacterium]
MTDRVKETRGWEAARLLAGWCALFAVAGAAAAQAPLAPPIENPSGRYLVWGDYRIELNQYGDLGRNWPTPDLVWEQFALLRRKARANPEPPNTLRAVLLVLPRVEATAVRRDGDRAVVVGRRTAEMTAAEVKWAIDQWRQFEEMVYVYSAGNAWLRTDVRVIDEPVAVETDENWEFWAGQQRALLDRYWPFERGDYQSYNSIYCSKDLGANPHGGTIGAVGGIKGCGTSDTAWYGESWKPNRTGYVALHEWLNQQCSATSNMMPYPDQEALWNNYVLHKIGYREDTALDDWPWLSMRRDVMMHVIRPGMWRRWTAIDPYVSTAIGRWMIFGPTESGRARALTAAPDADGVLVELEMGKYTHFDLAAARAPGGEQPAIVPGTYYFRTGLAAEERKEVRLWAGADERFQLWLNGVQVRDGWGWNYAEDDGCLIEKVIYATLERGLNSLVLALPNVDLRVELRVRLCDTDGSGRPPAGVSAVPVRGGREPLPLAAQPAPPDFRRPRFHAWAEINDQPWTKLPRLGETELRQLTGIGRLALRTAGAPRRNADGEEYEPPQHLFLDVPEGSVSSPWTAQPSEDAARLDNDLDFNWESLAWLRVPARSGPEKDLLLLRFDVAEPLLHLLRTAGRPAHESLVGWVLVEHKLAYAALVDLDLQEEPDSALGLLSKRPE